MNPSKEQLKEAIAFAFGDSLMVKATTRADLEITKALEAYGRDGEGVKSEDGADVAEKWK